MEDIVYNSVRLEENTYYFLYIGEIKNIGLNDYVAQALRREHGSAVKPISIVPDVLAGYPDDNLVVINPDAQRQAGNGERPVALRVPMHRFVTQASTSAWVRELVNLLLQRQNELYIWMYESRPEMTLTDIERVRLLGPLPSLAHRLNDKIWQYENFNDVVPVVDYQICVGAPKLLRTTEAMRPDCPHGIFVTRDYSAGGSASMVTTAQEQVERHFTDPFARYLACRYLPHVFDPTVLAVVANERDVLVAGVADMIIEGGNAFRGSSFPSVLPERVRTTLREYTRRVGRLIGRLGYRGIFGCDYIVDADENVWFIELNPRKQGTTMEFCCALERMLGHDAPNLPELEYHAVLHDSFPGNTAWPFEGEPAQVTRARNIHWCTYNLKMEADVTTSAGLAQDMPERQLFGNVAAGEPGGHLILEHVGPDMLVRPGTFLGRVVAVDSHRGGMMRLLEQGRRRLMDSILPDTSAPNHTATKE